MSNGAKLIVIVLGFFLALTFVRAVFIDNDSDFLVFVGDAPVSFVFSVTNTSAVSVKPSFLTDGPFTLLFNEEDAQSIIPAHDTKIYSALLQPSPVLREGDLYHGQIRVVFPNEAKEIPLMITKKSPPLLSSGTLTGFISFISIGNSDALIDVLLVIVIVVLGIALIARIRNRILEGKSK